jgi:hypothetical protein
VSASKPFVSKYFKAVETGKPFAQESKPFVFEGCGDAETIRQSPFPFIINQTKTVGAMTPMTPMNPIQSSWANLGKVLCPSGWRNHRVLCGIYGCNLWNGLVLNPKAGLTLLRQHFFSYPAH